MAQNKCHCHALFFSAPAQRGKGHGDFFLAGNEPTGLGICDPLSEGAGLAQNSVIPARQRYPLGCALPFTAGDYPGDNRGILGQKHHKYLYQPDQYRRAFGSDLYRWHYQVDSHYRCLGISGFFLYKFNLLAVGFGLVPFLGNLLLFGWAVGLFTMALIFRYGRAAEALIWGVPFFIQPISAVFYPVSVLPDWLQKVAYLLPSTYVFEGMRQVLATGVTDISILSISFGLNLVYLLLGSLYFSWMLYKVREKGYLSRLHLE